MLARKVRFSGKSKAYWVIGLAKVRHSITFETILFRYMAANLNGIARNANILIAHGCWPGASDVERIAPHARLCKSVG